MTLNKILSTHPWSFKKNAHMDYVRMPDRIYGRPSLFLNWTNNFLNVLSNLGEPPSSRICQTPVSCAASSAVFQSILDLFLGQSTSLLLWLLSTYCGQSWPHTDLQLLLLWWQHSDCISGTLKHLPELNISCRGYFWFRKMFFMLPQS